MGDYGKDLGITAGVGCATAFLWSALAGKADLRTAKGWARALMGCAGSSANGLTIYALSNRLVGQDTARKITAGWFGFQTASSFTQTLGNHFRWHEKTAYNVIAFPLNYGAAPISSTVGLVWGLIGEAASSKISGVHLFGGSLVFRHELCIRDNHTQLGAIMQSCNGNYETIRYHELGHQAQFSIMGDVGMAGWLLLSIAGQLIFKQTFKPENFIYENWAEDYSVKLIGSEEERTKQKIRNILGFRNDFKFRHHDYMAGHYGNRYFTLDLSEDVEIYGVPCDKSEPVKIDMISAGMESATLSKSYKIPKSNIVIPKGLRLYRIENGMPERVFGSWVFLTKRGIPLKVNHMELTQEGRVRSVVLDADHKIGPKDSIVTFDDAGSVSSVHLRGNYEINGVPCAKQTLEFDENGWFKSPVKLSADYTIGSVTYHEGSELLFDSDKKLKEVRLSAIQIIDGYPCAQDTKATFYKNERLSDFTLAADFPIKLTDNAPADKVPCKAGHEIQLHVNGQIKSGTLAKDYLSKEGIPCAANTFIQFHENGYLKEAALSRDHTIQGVFYKAGSKVFFNEDGRLKYATEPEKKK